MDPIADKAMTGAALIMLSVWEYVPWWMTILILVREFGITLMRFTILKYGALPANLAGKAKTMVQTIAITFCLLPFERSEEHTSELQSRGHLACRLPPE